MQRKWFKINASDIALVQFILEGYEGLVTVSTIDPKEAIIQILIMPDFGEDVEGIMVHLKDRFIMKEIPSCHIQVNAC
ncbi:MAG: DUF4911 domain-containing protein [Smithella sp.]|jgi:hypothetical protein